MLIRLWFPACDLFDPARLTDAFWVECDLQEALHLTPELHGVHQQQQATHPTWPLCFLVSRDGQQVQPHPRVFPYAGQWGNWNPFRAVQPLTLSSLNELEQLQQPLSAPWTWPDELGA
ncbi:hypothetical protein DAETH_10030 [Deinococcus aetherius]|uniref:Uncharacterized protein n=1 Tax=Deinococcus aetherius TaxID=200252 RepID=A0ABN6REG1_9DEIO|nr:hypothetical protein [Deinococcus aetherius]BDP41034.1 hypothetical protein DAETH_10030 [Deinococcus aetherius]